MITQIAAVMQHYINVAEIRQTTTHKLTPYAFFDDNTRNENAPLGQHDAADELSEPVLMLKL